MPDITTLYGAAVEFVIEHGETRYVNDTTTFNGMAIEFSLAASDVKVPDTTRLTGFAIELIDFPFYSFAIIETKI